MNAIHETALELHAHGIHALPILNNGAKHPPFNEWQNLRPTPEDLAGWFGGDKPRYVALGAVTGTPSGNIEMTETEGRASHQLPALIACAKGSGLGPLWDRLCAGWMEESPSGGIHWFYKVSDHDVPEAYEIANRPATPEEFDVWKVRETAKAEQLEEPNRTKRLERIARTTAEKVPQVLAETRGTGNQTVMAPTPGSAHKSGEPWKRLRGGPATIPTITWEERNAFHALLHTIDEMPATTAGPTHPAPQRDPLPAGAGLNIGGSLPHDDGERPGDHYNRTANWADILQPEGWTHHHGPDAEGQDYWTRPNKDPRDGHSASTRPDGNLYIFSSSTTLPTDEPHTKTFVYAHYHHGGDYSAAVSQLRADGYGAPRPTKPHTRTKTKTDLTDDSQWEDRGLRSHQRLASRYSTYAKGKVLYVHGTGWHHWDGKRWAPDEREANTTALLEKLLRISWAEAMGNPDLAADVKASMTATGTAGVLSLASRKLFTVDVDKDPWLLNCQNGTLDLHTLELRPHDPTDHITKITAAAYDKEATSTTWTYFLNSSLPNEEVRAFLQRYAGQALVGRVRDQVLIIATGGGRNGKGVLSRALKNALGSYAVTVSNDLLLASRYGNKSAGDLAAQMQLRGARWADMSEIQEGSKLDEATMKNLTGGDTITAKFMGQNFVEFRPSHSFFLLANDLPAVNANSTAVWARMRAVPFTENFEGREDEDLDAKLELETDAILTWAIEGLREHQSIGLAAPDAVQQRTKKYRDDNDPLGRFISDECLVNPAAGISRAGFADAYDAWARHNKEKTLSPTQIAAQMKHIPGITEFRSKTGRFWNGIQVAPETTETS